MTKSEIIEYIAAEMIEYYGAILDTDELKSITTLASLDPFTYDSMVDWERTVNEPDKDKLLFQMVNRVLEATKDEKILYTHH